MQNAVLSAEEAEVVVLLSAGPIVSFPPARMPTVHKLVRDGVVAHNNDQWYLTKVGLIIVGEALH